MISVNADPMEPVATFPYLGGTVAYKNSAWVALYQNLWMAWRRWEIVGKVVTKTGEMVRSRGMLYKEVV